MLYVTTRTKNDTFTAARALAEDRSSDGGLFVPLRLPQFDPAQIRQLGEQSFSQNVADVINLFFGALIVKFGPRKLIAADLFGQHSFAKIMGVFVSVNTAGYALGAPIANLIYDLAGSYAAVLIVAAVIMLVSMPLFQKAMTAAEKERH